MKLLKSLGRSAAAIALLGAPAAIAQDAAVDAETEAAIETPKGPGLWSVSDEDTTIYLFGTVHVLRPDVDWYKPYVAEALAASDEVVTEIDMDEAAAAAMSMVQAATLPSGTTLRSLMTDENRAEYEAALTTLGLPVGSFDQFEPWFAAVNLQILPLVMAGYDPMAGVDQLVLDRAPEGATRAALETVEFQIGLFDQLPQESQLAMLDQTAENLDQAVALIDGMVGEWMAGDADDLAALMNQGLADPAVYDALLTKRNVNWAKWIEQRLDRPGTVFIAVGAGHLAGADSVQAQLESLGLKAQRLD